MIPFLSQNFVTPSNGDSSPLQVTNNSNVELDTNSINANSNQFSETLSKLMLAAKKDITPIGDDISKEVVDENRVISDKENNKQRDMNSLLNLKELPSNIESQDLLEQLINSNKSNISETGFGQENILDKKREGVFNSDRSIFIKNETDLDKLGKLEQTIQRMESEIAGSSNSKTKRDFFIKREISSTDNVVDTSINKELNKLKLLMKDDLMINSGKPRGFDSSINSKFNDNNIDHELVLSKSMNRTGAINKYSKNVNEMMIMSNGDVDQLKNINKINKSVYSDAFKHSSTIGKGNFEGGELKGISDDSISVSKVIAGNNNITQVNLNQLQHSGHDLNNLQYVDKNSQLLQATGTNSASPTPFVMTEINTVNQEEIINKISEFVKFHNFGKFEELNLVVKHRSLGDFQILASKMKHNDIVDLKLIVENSSREFFNENQNRLTQSLAKSGINLGNLKIVTNDHITNEMRDLKFNDKMSESFDQKNSMSDLNKRESHNRDSNRRRELWEEYLDRRAA